MQTNPAVEQSKIIRWSKSLCNQSGANLPNRYSSVCWKPVTHAQTWASDSALYRFGRLSQSGRKGEGLWRKGFAEEPSFECRMKFWASKRRCKRW